MQKKFKKAALLILTVILTFSLMSVQSLAAEPEREVTASARSSERLVRTELRVKGIPSKSISAYTPISLIINGRLVSYTARIISGEIYIPLRNFVRDMTSATVSYSSSSRTLTVRGDGHNISVSDGAYVFYASDRPLFFTLPSVVLSDGAMYSPASVISKAFGVKIALQNSREVKISGYATPLRHASAFYREDEVYWLSRIINAESRGEPLLGQIAVGSVVLNRVASSAYPNTIWGVIFDKKYGVQFSPIIDGSIYASPSYNSVLAAKICLEGYRVSEDILFFLYPRASTSSWIPKSREYRFTVGRHDFYA